MSTPTGRKPYYLTEPQRAVVHDALAFVCQQVEAAAGKYVACEFDNLARRRLRADLLDVVEIFAPKEPRA